MKPQPRKSKLQFVLFTIPVLVFLIVYFGFDFNGLYGQDSHEYFRYAKALRHFFLTGSSPGDYFWSLGYPLIGLILSLVTGNVLLSLQLLSLISFLGMIFYCQRIFNHAFPGSKFTLIYILGALVFSPHLLRASSLVMSDMLAVFFITAAFYYFLKYRQNPLAKNSLLFFLLSASAVMTRYVSAVVLFPVGLIMTGMLLKNGRIKEIALVLLSVLVCFAPHFLLRTENSTDFLNHTWLVNWSPSNFFRSNFETVDGFAHNKFINILYSFFNIVHPIYLFFGILVLIWVRREDFSNRTVSLSLLMTLLYAFFLAGIPFQNKRFLMLSFPFALFILYPAFERMMNLISNQKLRHGVISVIVLIQVTLSYFYFKEFIERNRLERTISETIKKYPAKTVYAFDVDMALNSYDVKNLVINLWEKDIDSFMTGHLVVFNEYAFNEQWKGRNPMTNWKKLESRKHLEVIEEFQNGWKLYEIK